jgi:hypothetical protein
MVAMAVIKIGRILVVAASTIASRMIIDCSFCFTRSNSTIAFVKTMPINIKPPSSAVTSTEMSLINKPKTG